MGFSANNHSCGAVTVADGYQHKHFADEFNDDFRFDDDNENSSLLSSEDDADDTSEDYTAEDNLDLDFNESCDGLVFGEEEEEDSKPPPPPCWSDKEVFECYEKHLCIPQENSSRIREPPLFIGEIKRKCIEKYATHFTTIDTITIFYKAIVPVYKTLPIDRTVVLLTKWDHQGMPVHIQVIETNEESQNQDQQKKSKESQEDQEVVYLYCFPLYVNPLENEYTSTTVQRCMLYSSTRFACGTFFYPVETPESELQEIDKV